MRTGNFYVITDKWGSKKKVLVIKRTRRGDATILMIDDGFPNKLTYPKEYIKDYEPLDTVELLFLIGTDNDILRSAIMKKLNAGRCNA